MLLQLLRSLRSPFALSTHVYNATFSYDLYKLALRNKVALSYLSQCNLSNSEAKKFYIYHYSRYRSLLNALCEVCDILNIHGFKYAVFKTLRPFDEDVADIDIICLASDGVEYKELEQILRNAGYVVMERGLYCTTFMDPRYHYATELMIDVYREISAGPLIYLDKKLISNYVTTRYVEGHKVKVLEPVAELLITVAHSLIKEMEIKLLDYLTTLHLMHKIDEDSITALLNLVKKSRLTYGTRLFFSVIAYLHKLAYNFVPSKIIKILKMLGGTLDVSNITSNNMPPYRLRPQLLIRVYVEKLRDTVFVQGTIKGLRWFVSRKSAIRLVKLFTNRPRIR